MKKRIVSLLLCLCMVFSLLPVSALAALNTGHKIDVTFKVLYVGDEFNIGYNYGSSEQTQFVCQYTTNHSDGAYSNHIIAISDIKAAAGRATVNSGYQIVGWSKEANANPKTWDLNMGGTTACNKGTPIYLVAKNPNPTPTKYTYHLIHEFNYVGGTRWDITATTAAESYQLDVNNGKPTRNGYSFAGWADKANAAAAKYSGGERITLTKDNPTKTIYAVWMPVFELRYDANGGTGAPASQTHTALAPTANKVTFTVPDQAPTKADYTFKGWADSADATEAKYRPGGTIDVQHKDSPKTVYAVWEKNDSPMPDTPVPPSDDDLKSAIGKIQVTDVSTPNCGTKNYDLIANTQSEPFNWTKTARLDQPEKYDGTIKTAPYVAKYNNEKTKAHELNDASQTTLKLVISYKNSKWVLDDGKTEIEVKHTESTPTETPPKAPTADELKKLEMAEMAVLVKCDVDDAQQHTEAYGLLGEYNEDYIVGEPKKVGNDWLCDINYVPDPYVAEFNKTFPTLKHIQNDEKIDPVTLIWGGENWQIKTQGRVHVTEEYTVTFNAYGGFPTPDEQHVKSGEKAVLPVAPTLKGYTFAFWYLGEDEQNATAYDFDTPVTGDITLTAKWNINKYTVTFDSYGGTPVPPAQKVEYGLTATKPDDPTLKGHTFAFWYLGEDEQTATAYNFGTPVTENITLTAKWNINKYTVTFDSNGGTPVPPAQKVEYGLTAAEPTSAPTKTGYTFDGWYLGDEKYDFSDAVEQDITLKAQWTLNTYNIASTLRVNNGEPVKDEGKTYSWTYRCGGKYGETIDYQQMIGALKARALKADKANEPCDAEIKLCFPGSTDSFSDAIKTYGQDGANWQAANNNTAYIRGYATTSYEVIFNSDGGSDVVTQIVKYGEKAEAPEAPTMKGYNFLGWFDKDGNPFNFDTEITHKTELKAQWEKKDYIIASTLRINGNEPVKETGKTYSWSHRYGGDFGVPIDYTDMFKALKDKTLEVDAENEPYDAEIKLCFPGSSNLFNEAILTYGQDGGGWNPGVKNTAYIWGYATTSYEVIFDSDGGSAVDTKIVKYGEKAVKPEDPTMKGYNFLGWFDKDGNPFNFDTEITHKTELTARWEKKTYTVTFDPNDGEVEPTSKTVTFDAAYGDLPTPTRAHHTFKGWYLGTDKVTEATIVKTAENHTLRAAWSRSYHALTINYVDKKGNPVADSYEASVALGADFSVTSPDVKGYKLRDKDDAVIEGTMTAEGYTYDVVYVKKSSGGSGVQIESPNKPEKDNSLKFNTADHFAYVNGYPDGTVKPTGDVTRAEVAAILYRVMDADCVKTYETTRCSFSDVVRGDWFNTYVATLENAGVIVDTRTNGKFRPNEAITRAELAAMLAQFADIKSAANSFNDVSARHWASDEIAVCTKMGWINGYPDGSFRPDATITRAEMMAMINRALDRTPKSVSDLLSGMKTWSDNANTGAWYYLDVQEATNSHTYTKSGTHETWKKLH